MLIDTVRALTPYSKQMVISICEWKSCKFATRPFMRIPCNVYARSEWDDRYHCCIASNEIKKNISIVVVSTRLSKNKFIKMHQPFEWQKIYHCRATFHSRIACSYFVRLFNITFVPRCHPNNQNINNRMKCTSKRQRILWWIRSERIKGYRLIENSFSVPWLCRSGSSDAIRFVRCVENAKRICSKRLNCMRASFIMVFVVRSHNWKLNHELS